MRRQFVFWFGICVLFYVFDETWVSLVLGVLLLLVAAFLVVVTVLRLRANKLFFYELYGEQSEQLAHLREMNGRLFRTQRTGTYSAAFVVFLWVGVPYLIIALFLGLNWWSVPIVLAAVLFNMGFRQLYPPVAVFLSTSNPDQIELCVELQYRAFPLKIVNMLSVEAIAAQKGHLKGLAALDGNRLAKSANWEDEIASVMSCVPLIIIDLRAQSAGLETERDIINRHGWHWKLVAIHAEGADIDRLEDEVFQSDKKQTGAIAWTRAADAPKTIVHSLIVNKEFPRMDRPAGLLLIPPEHDYEDWHLWERHPRRVDS